MRRGGSSDEGHIVSRGRGMGRECPLTNHGKNKLWALPRDSSGKHNGTSHWVQSSHLFNNCIYSRNKLIWISREYYKFIKMLFCDQFPNWPAKEETFCASSCASADLRVIVIFSLSEHNELWLPGFCLFSPCLSVWIFPLPMYCSITQLWWRGAREWGGRRECVSWEREKGGSERGKDSP